MVKHIGGAFALAFAAWLSGCATIVHGTTEQVRVDSDPPGAQVSIDETQHVVTPSTVTLARGSSHVLVFQKPGYQDAVQNLKSTPSGWILGNILAGGVIGVAIDASDGAAHKLSSDSVNVTLTPVPATPAVAAPAYNLRDLFPAAATTPQTPPPVADTPAAHQDDEQPDPAAMLPQGPPPPDFSDDEAGFRPAPPVHP